MNRPACTYSSHIYTECVIKTPPDGEQSAVWHVQYVYITILGLRRNHVLGEQVQNIHTKKTV